MLRLREAEDEVAEFMERKLKRSRVKLRVKIRKRNSLSPPDA